ncbi:hypothetical protein MAR_020905 [Mya arenaria]|uniref:Uncharacterized protein n=1 Tax=Mya arenaria TaxID=6604 RepID=A0ABY7EA77_MYAAR|nr:hypothetical protein MAR_020905 [Mya arenaria]
MATTDTDSVHDHMTNLRLKMVQQKIQNEKDRLANRPPSEESTNDDLERQARLQQAMLRRQELLDKIRREQLLNEDGRRPASDRSRRRYTPSPLPVPPSRRSLPDFARYNNYYNYNHQPDTFRSKPATPRGRPQYPLPPINLPPGPPPPPIIIPAPAPQIMQQPAPQYIQTAPQHIIQQVPNPIIQDLTPQQNRGMFNKADFGEMMMMQNAQMHQMAPRASGNVHHHHYTSPPPSQPAVHHYTTMPTMDIRGGYPLREQISFVKYLHGF